MSYLSNIQSYNDAVIEAKSFQVVVRLVTKNEICSSELPMSALELVIRDLEDAASVRGLFSLWNRKFGVTLIPYDQIEHVRFEFDHITA